jgi:hypothetical protein
MSAGATSSRSLNASRSCCTMTTAIAEVKPVATGYGMNLIAVPQRASPRPMSRTPP